MAWVTPPNVITGDLILASWGNTIADDLKETAPAKAVAQGDLFYATGANAISRLAKGTPNQLLWMNGAGTVPEWTSEPNVQGVRWVNCVGNRLRAFHASGTAAPFLIPLGNYQTGTVITIWLAASGMNAESGGRWTIVADWAAGVAPVIVDFVDGGYPSIPIANRVTFYSANKANQSFDLYLSWDYQGATQVNDLDVLVISTNDWTSGSVQSGGTAIGYSAPVCKVTNSLSQSIPNLTWTALTFNTEDFDPQGMHSTSSNTERINMPATGVYLVEYGVTFAANGTGIREVDVHSNLQGASVAYSTEMAPSASYVTIIRGAVICRLVKDDYIYLQVRQNSGAALDSLASGYMTPKLGAALLYRIS